MTNKQFILSQIKLLKGELRELGVIKIGLFGSYARGEQSENSDIDILIEFEPDQENFDNYMSVYDEIEKRFTNEKIEVVTTNCLSPHIGPKILKEVTYS